MRHARFPQCANCHLIVERHSEAAHRRACATIDGNTRHLHENRRKRRLLYLFPYATAIFSRNVAGMLVAGSGGGGVVGAHGIPIHFGHISTVISTFAPNERQQTNARNYAISILLRECASVWVTCPLTIMRSPISVCMPFHFISFSVFKKF